MVVYEATLPWRKWIATVWEDFGAAPLECLHDSRIVPRGTVPSATAESGLKATQFQPIEEKGQGKNPLPPFQSQICDQILPCSKIAMTKP
jgi:hypothetical protein